MTDKLNSKIKMLVDEIVGECDCNKENWSVYRNQLEGVEKLAKVAGYNNKTIRYIKDGRSVCFDLGHGSTLS